MKKEEKAPREDQEAPSPGPQNAVQRFYEKFRWIPLKYIDAFIAVCVTALVLLLIWGTLKGRGIL